MRTTKMIFGAAALATAPRSNARAEPPERGVPDSTRLSTDIAFLASDALEGRGTGTPGFDSAASFVAARYATLGLHAFAPGYFQPFIARSAMLAHSGGPAELPTRNVVALLPGRDPALRGQVIVVGAHLD